MMHAPIAPNHAVRAQVHAAAPRVLAIASCTLCLLLAACDAPQYEERWDRLHTGMSQAEVQTLLGKPSSVHTPKRSAAGDGAEPGASGVPGTDGASTGSTMRGERWQYGDTLSSFATGAVFPDEADERAWCVFFGQDGKVIGYRAAGWAAGRRARDPADAPGLAPTNAVNGSTLPGSR